MSQQTRLLGPCSSAISGQAFRGRENWKDMHRLIISIHAASTCSSLAKTSLVASTSFEEAGTHRKHAGSWQSIEISATYLLETPGCHPLCHHP